MKRLNLKYIFLCLFFMVSLDNVASTLIDGVYYNLNKTKLTATVTYKDTLYNSYSGRVTIPDSFTYGTLTYNVTSIGTNAFWGCKDLISVKMPNTITSIGKSSFSRCSVLTSITIPSSVTSISNGAFEGCENLTSVTLDGDTLVKKNYNTNLSFSTIFGKQVICYELRDDVTNIGNYVFYDCSKLKSINMPKNLYNIGRFAFYGCSSLASITIPSNVTSIGSNAFGGCENLTSVTLHGNAIVSKNNSSTSSLSTIFGEQVTNYELGDNITVIGNYAFYGCTNLTSITIPNSVTTIGIGAFGENLTSVTLLGDTFVKKDYNSTSSLRTIFGEQVTHYVLDGDIKKIGNYVFYDCTKLTSIQMPNSITNIGSHAFSGCINLKNIDMPNSVTIIGEGAFEDCTSITSVTLSNNMTKLESYIFQNCTSLLSFIIPDKINCIGNSAFQNCVNLKSIILPENVTSIGNSAFQNCSSLSSINIPNNVTTIGSYAFSGCKNITSVDIPKNLKSIENNTFQHCTSLTSINIPNNVAKIGSFSFLGCIGLTSITIPNSVISIENSAFSDCTGLNSVTIPNSVTRINCYVFSGCTSLKSIHLSENLTIIDDFAFSGCTGLLSVEIPIKVDSIGISAFSDCKELKSIIIPNSVKSIKQYAFLNCSNLSTITIPDSLKTIENSTFQNCIGLIDIKIPDKVESIKSSSFRNCSGLISLELPNNVKSIESFAFQNCTELASISIPNSITRIEYSVFSGCTSLTFVKIPSNVTTIEDYAFNGCIGLSSVELHDKIEKIGSYAFSDCANLTSFIIPNNVKSIGSFAFQNCSNITSISIPTSVTNIENNPFSGCTNLTNITVEKDNAVYDSRDNCNAIIIKETNMLICGCKNTVIPSSILGIGDYAFQKCSGFTSVMIPDSVTSIGNYAFQNCRELTKVVLPTNVTTIGSYAFQNCSNLTFVTIPNSVTSIKGGAFQNCPQLTSITLPDNVTELGSTVFHFTTKVCVNVGSVSLLSLWDKDITPYSLTGDELPAPYPSINNITQTTVMAKANHIYEGYTYELSAYSLYNKNVVVATESLLTGLFPETNHELLLSVSKGNTIYKKSIPFLTMAILPSVDTVSVKASSISARGNYTLGDANVVSQSITLNSIQENGNEIKVIGLDPSTNYKVTFTIEVQNDTIVRKYSQTKTFKTKALSLFTLPPKIVSIGDVIVQASSNLDDDEKDVGFEWREMNLDNTIDSLKDVSLYEGMIEGYISNLNSEITWQYRPYYRSKSNNNKKYGKWETINPTDISNIDPIAHTYADIRIENNTAYVNGYILKGSDSIEEMGFMYWKNIDQINDTFIPHKVVEIPNNALKVTVEHSKINTLITSILKNLTYDTIYDYVVFVTTSVGQTFYGDVRSFSTDTDPTGIDYLEMESQIQPTTEIARYNFNGHRISSPQRGINIIRMSNGTVRKVMVK